MIKMVTETQNKKMLKVIEGEKSKKRPSQYQKQIAKVFAELEKQKIKCEQNFWCCQTCGSHALGSYEDNPNFEGYCFYHNQDYDCLKKEGYTHLAYGSFRGIDMVSIGNKIVQEFKKEGIKVTWNGKAESRIMIEFL